MRWSLIVCISVPRWHDPGETSSRTDGSAAPDPLVNSFDKRRDSLGQTKEIETVLGEDLIEQHLTVGSTGCR